MNAQDNYTVCGEIHCLNGGTCTTTIVSTEDGETKEVDSCDCNTAYTDTDKFAGEYCEYKSTTFCTQRHQGQDLQDVLFCVNEGTCRESILDGCDWYVQSYFQDNISLEFCFTHILTFVG